MDLAEPGSEGLRMAETMDDPKPNPEPDRETPPPAFEEREEDGSRNGGDPGEAPDDLQNDPAYEPDEPLKGIKGG
jgi:hypothetical protein